MRQQKTAWVNVTWIVWAVVTPDSQKTCNIGWGLTDAIQSTSPAPWRVWSSWCSNYSCHVNFCCRTIYLRMVITYIISPSASHSITSIRGSHSSQFHTPIDLKKLPVFVSGLFLILCRHHSFLYLRNSCTCHLSI